MAATFEAYIEILRELGAQDGKDIDVSQVLSEAMVWWSQGESPVMFYRAYKNRMIKKPAPALVPTAPAPRSEEELRHKEILKGLEGIRSAVLALLWFFVILTIINIAAGMGMGCNAAASQSSRPIPYGR
jgi:hypothetical protein